MQQRRPAELRRIIQGLTILTLLAWATLTLLSQWGLGAEAGVLPAATAERFVPGAGFPGVATIELRVSAVVGGAEVRLSDIARWSDADAPALRPSADLTVGRFAGEQSSCTIDVEAVKEVLSGAGVNLGLVNFRGAMSCKVSRSEARLKAEIEQAVVAAGQAMPASAPIAAVEAPPAAAQPAGSLRDLLVADLVERLGIPGDSLQLHFSGEDEKLVNLPRSHVQFELEPQKLRKLGDVTWNVTLGAGGARQKVPIKANVRLWRNQLITTRPLAYKQVIGEQDITERRVLVDRLEDEAPLSKAQVVGQQAGRDLSPGTILTGRMIEAVQMARLGQLITVAVELGRVQVIWVGEARESGCLGQTIRVRKPGTREEFSVVLTGPQQAKLMGSTDRGLTVAAAP